MTNLSEISALRDNRPLWTSVGGAVGLMMTFLGGQFAIGGIKATPAPAVYGLIVDHLPGGIRAYGVVICLAGLSLLHGVAARRDRWAEYSLGAIIGVALAIAVTFVATWVLLGIFLWGWIVFWLFMAALAWACWRNMPTDGRRRVA